ncbi:MAG: formamidopyrimidine-DNA glycosylase [Bacteroidetes bacterium]|nr:MAG: formamidopyrimidine-DNA glycosylase [Bacteroidota bacterium]
MAELPRAEEYRHLIEENFSGKTIAIVQVDEVVLLRENSREKLRSMLIGKKMGPVFRYGKMLFASLGKNKGFILFHFGPEGFPVVGGDGTLSPKCVFSMGFTDGSFLWVINERRIGEIGWVKDKEDFIRRRKYGPDALVITEKQFLNNIRRRRSCIKALLNNQNIVAGIGNAYADEILFRSGLHPQLPMNMISTESLRKVYKNIREVMSEALTPEGSAGHFFVRNRKAGIPCPACHTPLTQKYVQSRSSYFCPNCQP